MKIQIEAEPNKDDVKQIQDGLLNYNLKHAKPDGWKLLTIFVRDDEGNIKGGLLGGTFWDWCHIDILWLDDTVRGGGIGTQLIQLVEQEAKARKCVGIFVDTMSWQAPDFYRKHGYEQWGLLDNFPPGHQRIFFKKQLADVDTPSST